MCWQNICNSVEIEDELNQSVHQLKLTISSLINTKYNVIINRKNQPINYIVILGKPQILSIFNNANLLQLNQFSTKLVSLKTMDIIKKPLTTLEQAFDVNAKLNMMCHSGIHYLAIANNMKQFSCAVIPENLTVKLQKELLQTRQQLELEIAQRCSLELALKKAEAELAKQVNQAPEQSIKLQQVSTEKISDCPVNHVELLLTNSELQELFQAFSDVYFRLDNNGIILSYHTSETAEFYLPSASFIGRHIQDIMPIQVGHELQEAIVQLNQTKSLVAIEYSLPTTAGEKSFEARLILSNQKQIIMIIRNITESNIIARKQAENKLKSSLKEKEVLLKEIHHRVKNNLQVISSLLRLQARYINDEKAIDIFQDSQNRVRAMAMIHENLYQSHDLAKIEVADYIEKLTNNLICSYGVKPNIQIHLEIEKFSLKIDTAIPCGLIINELISNALKHAFNNREQGDIYVNFSKLYTDKYSLSISDNGIGLPKDIDYYKNQSLGLQLVWNLVEQLEGSITFNPVGTVFKISF
ncbi:sensor histidine kinase [Fortiea contorta]|uniref:sensor histidine kinase n=1 Tax=Fortiea contorta TaxID=1892405 RepID=UPI0003812EB3|nr:histidine kinase dimerization/phosphoacceptor domain -containing protein [Fortiea contorta]